MDWIVWLVVIIVVVAVVWRLLNRSKSRSGATTSGITQAPEAPEPADVPQEAAAVPEVPAATSEPAMGVAMETPPAAEAVGTAGAAESAGATPVDGPPEAAGTSANAEWETQWSETAPPADTPAQAAHFDPAHGAHVAAAEPGAVAEPAAVAGHPVHHPEYTEPHAPTLPGAESAAAEPVEDDAAAGTGTGTGMPAAAAPGTQPASPAEAETLQTAASSATAEAFASHTAEPTGHLASEQPYGEGSAAPAADGSGPEGFTVKGNASSMVYHDETSPAYEETRAEVWFASAAHAEAAGFRPPRRTRQ